MSPPEAAFGGSCSADSSEQFRALFLVARSVSRGAIIKELKEKNNVFHIGVIKLSKSEPEYLKNKALTLIIHLEYTVHMNTLQSAARQ